MSENKDTLVWRDLSAEDVYYIAHLENDARDSFASRLAQIAFSNNYIEAQEVALNNNPILHYESVAATWFESQATLLNKKAESPDSFFNDEMQNIDFELSSYWLTAEIRSIPDMNLTKLADLTGISRQTLHAVKRGDKHSAKITAGVISALAETKGIIGKEKSQYINNARDERA